MAFNSIEVNQNIDELKKLLDRAATQTEELNKTLDEIKAFKAFVNVGPSVIADEIDKRMLKDILNDRDHQKAESLISKVFEGLQDK